MYYLKLGALAAFLFISVAACTQQPTNTAQPSANSASNASTTNVNAAAVPATSSTPAAAAPADDASAAGKLYTVHCMTCHKDSGKGGPVTVEGKKLDPEDLTGDKMKKKSDDKLRQYIADGLEDEGMPAFKDKLSPAEIDSLVKHIRVLQAK